MWNTITTTILTLACEEYLRECDFSATQAVGFDCSTNYKVDDNPPLEEECSNYNDLQPSRSQKIFGRMRL